MRLAKSLHKCLWEIEAIDSRELIQWYVYDQIEGLAPVDSWKQTAQTSWVIAKVNGNKHKETDFDPYHRARPKPIQSAAEQIELFKAMFPNAKIGNGQTKSTNQIIEP